jgi:alkanesulfonate monooxygenase
MSLPEQVEFITLVPTHGDGPYPGSEQGPTPHRAASGNRQPTVEYLAKVARAAEEGGFGTVLIGVGSSSQDGFVVSSFLARHTEKLRFLIALRPGFTAPAVLARQASTFDYLSGGRLALNIVTGISEQDTARDGDFLDHDSRYRRTLEFVRLVKRLFTETNITHEGEFYRLQGATLFPRPVQNPHPPFFIAGESEASRAVIAQEAQVYVTWGGPLLDLSRRISEVRRDIEAQGRKAGYSISFQVILGETEEAAWAKAEEMRQHMSAAVIERQKDYLRNTESVGQRRLGSYVEQSATDGFRIGPNLWAGLTQVLGGNSIALVGTPDQVADRIVEYVSLGYDHVLLRGFPHLETIEQLGREVLPRVKARLAALALQSKREVAHVLASS